MTALFRISKTLFVLLLCVELMSQDKALHGRVIDSDSGQSLSGVNISVYQTDQGTVTDARGRFTLLLDSNLMRGITLTIQHLGFEAKVLNLSYVEILGFTEQGAEPLLIVMSTFSYPLDTALIIGDPMPEVVYSSERHHVADYTFLGDSLLILACPRRLGKNTCIYLLDGNMDKLDSISLIDGIKAQGLLKDYAGRVYLEAEHQLFSVSMKHDGLGLDEVDVRMFQQQIAPVIDTVLHTVYFSSQGIPFPAVEYYDFDRLDSLYALIRVVADKFMMELCRAEYKYLTTRDRLRLYRLELATGVEKEVLACMASFEDGLYYKSIYAPMFIWKDTLALFDHIENTLWIYNKESELLDSLPIDYHRPEKVIGNPFTKELVMDEKTGIVYAVFQKPGGRCWLERVDRGTGRTEKVIEVRYPYPSAIHVRQNELYYLYRPYESSQKKYLYKERL